MAGIAGVDVGDAPHALPDHVGEPPDLPDSAPVVPQEPLLKDGNQDRLDRIERDRGEAQDIVLHEHEEDNHQQRPAVDSGNRDGCAHEAPHRLHFPGDHGDQFALGDSAEMGQGKPENSVIELEAKAPQHPLSGLALVDLDEILEPAIDEDESQKYERQQKKIGNLVEFLAEKKAWEILAVDHFIDDDLGKIEREIQERK